MNDAVLIAKSAGWQRYGLKRRLILKVSGLVVLAMAVVMLSMLYVMRDELDAQSRAMVRELGRSSQIQLENRIAYLVESTRRLAANPFMINALLDSRARIHDLPKLIDNFREGSALEALALFDADGRLVYQADEGALGADQVAQLGAAQTLGATALFIDPALARLLIIEPISYYENQGALLVGFDLNTLLKSHAARSEIAYLGLSQRDVMLVQLQPHRGEPLISIRVSPAANTPYLQQLNVTLDTGVPESQFGAVMMASLSRFVAIGLLLVVVSAMVAARMGQRIARPILELHRRVSQIDDGARCSPLGTNDELEALAAAFDQRTSALESARFQLLEQRDRFHFEANHDTLTGLPNRNNFNQRMRELLAAPIKYRCQLALLYIDLDRFKLINDSLGHPVGDRVLQAVADRLQALSTGLHLFRHGGDEFMLVVPTQTADELIDLLEQIAEVLAQPVRMGEHGLDVRASIGVTFYPQDGSDLQTLMRNADIAMFQAKNTGGGHYRIFDEEMSRKAYDRMAIEAGLRRAIELDELVVFYQPQIDLCSGNLLGTEALVRWRHPERGLIMPGVFIPVAEESRLIIDLGQYVLRAACRQQALWYRAGLTPGRVSVNLAGPQIQHPDLPALVQSVLSETGCRGEWLELEVTEGFIMRDPIRAIATLKRLRAMGISLAVDDFGTGYSSLTYLKRLPVTKLKIDQSFVRNAVNDPQDAAIIEVIVALGNNLNLELIAEGVETASQRDLLVRLGCRQAQGYLYGRPVPPEELSAMLRPGYFYQDGAHG